MMLKPLMRDIDVHIIQTGPGRLSGTTAIPIPVKHQIKDSFTTVVLSVLLLLLPGRLNAQSAVQRIDDRIMMDLQNDRTPAQTSVFLFLSNTYRYGDIGAPAGLLAAGLITHDRAMRDNSLFVASSTAFSYGLDLLIKHLVKRRRPFLQNLQLVPIYRAGGFSFPSGHTSSTFATATALSMAYPKWFVIAPSLLWAGSVSYSRMYLGEHYPTDVGGGIILGGASALSMSFLRK